MTIEEITQTLQTVAENQATHSAHMAEMEKAQARHAANMAKLEEAHARHTADVAEIDKMIAANVESLNRHDRQLGRIFEAIGKNEERFAELADGMRRLEGSYELLESFVRESKNETRDYFAETDRKLAMLAIVQAETAELVAELVRDTNGRFAETDKRLAEFVSETNRRFSVLERNGSTARPKAKSKKTAAKKTKKGAK